MEKVVYFVHMYVCDCRYNDDRNLLTERTSPIPCFNFKGIKPLLNDKRYEVIMRIMKDTDEEYIHYKNLYKCPHKDCTCTHEEMTPCFEKMRKEDEKKWKRKNRNYKC